MRASSVTFFLIVENNRNQNKGKQNKYVTVEGAYWLSLVGPGLGAKPGQMAAGCLPHVPCAAGLSVCILSLSTTIPKKSSHAAVLNAKGSQVLRQDGRKYQGPVSFLSAYSVTRTTYSTYSYIFEMGKKYYTILKWRNRLTRTDRKWHSKVFKRADFIWWKKAFNISNTPQVFDFL